MTTVTDRVGMARTNSILKKQRGLVDKEAQTLKQEEPHRTAHHGIQRRETDKNSPDATPIAFQKTGTCNLPLEEKHQDARWMLAVTNGEKNGKTRNRPSENRSTASTGNRPVNTKRDATHNHCRANLREAEMGRIGATRKQTSENDGAVQSLSLSFGRGLKGPRTGSRQSQHSTTVRITVIVYATMTTEQNHRLTQKRLVIRMKSPPVATSPTSTSSFPWKLGRLCSLRASCARCMRHILGCGCTRHIHRMRHPRRTW